MKKKSLKTRRVIAAMLAASLVLPALPMAQLGSLAASAAEAVQAAVEQAEEALSDVTQASVIASGTCGEALTWTFDDAGTLTISGSGAMEDYSGYSYVPWYNYQNEIKKIVLGDGVTSIGDYAFSHCNMMTSINIPDGVTSIGYQSFCDCTSLTGVTIPDSVTSIEKQAFFNCGLTSIDIPDSVTSVGTEAFYYCDELTQVTIGSGLTSLPIRMLGQCSSLTEVTIPDTVTSVEKELLYYCVSLTDVTIGSGLTAIGDGMFSNCTALTEITIPDTITSIGISAFSRTSLTEITIPETVTSIGISAFYNCTSLTEITIPEAVKSIADQTFYNCSALKDITFTGNQPSFGENAFYGVTATAYYPDDNSTWQSIYPVYSGTITWSAYVDGVVVSGQCGDDLTWVLDNTDNKGVLTISGTGPMWEFEGVLTPWQDTIPQIDLKLIRKVIIEEGATSIGSQAFYNCRNLKTVILPNTMEKIGNQAFYYTALRNITIPDSVTEIGVQAFTSTRLERVTLPQSVSKIDEYAFNGCTKLESITIANSSCEIVDKSADDTPTIPAETTIYGYAGSTAETYAKSNGNSFVAIYEGLEFISNGDGTCTLTGIGTFAGTELVIPSVSPDGETVTAIGVVAFENCKGLTSITIPASVTSIGDSAFGGCSSLARITVDAGNPVYHSAGNCLIETASKTLLLGCKNSTIPSDGSVTSIYGGPVSAGAFTGCIGLTGITIPNTVTSIGVNAFADCTSLVGITIPESVTEIGLWAFQNCDALARIDVAEGNPVYHSDGNCLIETASKTLIAGCKSSVIPSNGSVTVIGRSTFEGCDALTGITIPDSVTEIGNSAFARTRLERVTLPQSVSKIDEYAFAVCLKLESITIANKSCRIVDKRADDAPTIPAETTIYGYAGSTAETYAETYGNPFVPFAEGLEYTSNGDGTCTVTGVGTFAGSELAIPPTSPDGEKVTRIGSYAFKQCTRLSSVVIPDGVTEIGGEAFSDCSRLAEISLPDSLTLIDFYSFCGCTRLASIEIPNGVATIGSAAFRDCTSLESIVLPDSVTEIKEEAFIGCTVLKSIELPNSVTRIESSVFWNCDALESITIPDGVTEIGMYTFYGCGSLTSIILPDSLRLIGDSAFYNCYSLTTISIPTSVIDLGNNTFSDNLRTIYISNPDCTVEYSGIPSAATIYGHVGSTAQAFAETNGNPFVALDEGLEYTSNGDGACYVSGMGNSTAAEIVIPAFSPNGNRVTAIGDGAFADCDGITGVTMPADITEIGDRAFYDCDSLTTINLNTVQVIGEEAFADCDSLANGSYLVVNAAEIGDRAFADCGIEGVMFTDRNCLLGSNIIPADVVIYGYAGSTAQAYAEVCGNPFYAVSGGLAFTSNGDGTCYVSGIGTCTDTDLVIPMCSPNGETVTGMGHRTFAYCTSITNVVIPISVIFIGEYALQGCLNLTSITIPDSVVEIGNGVFNNCSSLTSITIPNSVTRISESMFYGCTNLTDITIPDSVTEIGGNAFAQCKSLTNIVLPDGLTTISSGLFSGCASLLSVTIPDGVTEIGSHAFYNCSALTSIVIPDGVTEIGSHAFYNCSALTSIVIPDGVTEIGGYAFFECRGLTSITFPESVTLIGESAASSCLCTIVLNPDCVLGNDAVGGGTVYGYAGSTTQEYAQNRGSTFIPLYVVDSDDVTLTDTEAIIDASNAAVDEVLFIPSEIASTLAGKTTTVLTPVGAVIFDPTASNKIATSDGDVLLELRDVTTDSEEAEGIMTVSVTLTADGIPVMPEEEADTNGKITLSIECAPDMERISVDYIADDGTTEAVQVSAYDPETGVVTFETTHFSRCKIYDMGHDLVYHASQNPSCTEIGWYAYETCTLCDYTTYVELPATGHSYGDWYETITPTCTTEGEEQRYCMTCGHSETNVLSALGHDLAQYQGKAPTCTEIGWDAYEVCYRCGYTTYTELPATDHSFGEWYESIAPTCTAFGEARRFCTNCSAFETRELGMLGHDFAQYEGKAPTCTEIGWDAYEVCTNCGYTTYTELPATGHSYGEWYQNIAPTCTTLGAERRNCANCEAYEMRELPANGHSYSEEVIEPTREHEGYTVHTCGACGDSYTDNYVDRLLGMAGDANGDGELSLRDAVVLQQYLNGMEVEIDLSCADVTVDGELTLRDAVLIQQYLNGWDVVLK